MITVAWVFSRNKQKEDQETETRERMDRQSFQSAKNPFFTDEVTQTDLSETEITARAVFLDASVVRQEPQYAQPADYPATVEDNSPYIEPEDQNQESVSKLQPEEELPELPVSSQQHDEEALAQAEQESMQMSAETQRDRQEMLAGIMRDRQEMLAESERNRQEILAQAEWERKQILIRANQEREQILAQAEQERRKILDKANSEADQLVEDYLVEYQMQAREDLRIHQQEAAREADARQQTMHDLVGEMYQQNQQFQSGLAGQLNSFQAQINQLIDQTKDDYYKSMQDWRSSLYQEADAPLAQSYIDYCRITNLDPQIRDLIVCAGGHSAENLQAADSLIHRLEGLDKTLKTFRRKFERSLAALDLYPYIPEPGEVYQPELHMLEDAEEEDDDSGNWIIKECRLPGIRKKVSDQDEWYVIKKAIVRIEEK